MAKNIYNAVRGAAEAQTGRVFKNAVGILKKSAIDTIRGGKKGGASNDFANAVGGKYSTQNLTFPLDLEGPTGANGNQGHYIQFFVNEQADEVLDYQDSRKKLEAGLDILPDDPVIAQAMAETERADGFFSRTKSDIRQRRDPNGVTARLADLKGIKPAKKASVKDNSLSIKRKATVRMPVSICMYMPPSVDVKYGADYQDTEMGTGTKMGVEAIQSILAGTASMDSAKEALKDQTGAIGDGIIKGGTSAIDLIPGFAGSNAAFEMQRGFIKAPRMELAFKGIPKRDFSYEFKMMPKSAAEAEMAKNIVKTFKMYMLPEIKSAGSMQLTTPATFDIQYMHLGEENMNLNKIGTCVLTNMDVKYGGDKYKTHADAVPVETSMTLSFKELDLVTREKAEQGF
mgnify:FL=1|tara:strand:+ start:2581 stop:3780 length:1200 start_codon:yes stop_codon:yes gene_type:complete